MARATTGMVPAASPSLANSTKEVGSESSKVISSGKLGTPVLFVDAGVVKVVLALITNA
jgi:hypothetical protein